MRTTCSPAVREIPGTRTSWYTSQAPVCGKTTSPLTSTPSTQILALRLVYGVDTRNAMS